MRAVAVLVILAISGTARADELDEARRLEASLEYEKALAIVESVIAKGGATPQQLVERHLYAGSLAGSIDQAGIAEQHFAIALCLAPNASLPDGTSPKITAPFYAARSRAVQLDVDVAVKGGAIVLTPKTDPLGLVVGTRVRFIGEDGSPRDQIERQSLRVVIPFHDAADQVAALDSHGNELWIGLSPVRGPLVALVAGSERGPWYKRATTWALVSAAGLVASGMCVWRFTATQEQFDQYKIEGTHDFSELQAIETRGKRWALATNITGGVSAASAAIFLVLIATQSRSPPVRITATPNSIGIAGSF